MHRNKAYIGKNALLWYRSGNGTQAAEKTTAYSKEEEPRAVHVSERSDTTVSKLWTPLRRVLLEKLPVAEQHTKFSAFCGTQRFYIDWAPCCQRVIFSRMECHSRVAVPLAEYSRGPGFKCWFESSTSRLQFSFFFSGPSAKFWNPSGCDRFFPHKF
jgi:hypothetical protein